ncbi:MAG: sirohydrochlorin cobaltochelatase [Deferrisomatales bacterium]
MRNWTLAAALAAAVTAGTAAAAPRPPILLVAFGTSVAEAQAALENVDRRVVAAYPDREVLWAFTSGRILAKLKGQGRTELFARRVPLRSVGEAYAALAAAGHAAAVVQSLHVVPGEEYEELLAVPTQGLAVRYGRPLIQDRAAAAELARVLSPRFGGPDEVTVLCGHGNEHHPRFNELLLALDEHLRATYRNAFLATVDGQPGTDGPLADARATGLTKVVFVPMMVVAGDHVMNDVMGDGPDSWKNRLGLEARAEPGMGSDDAVVKLFLDRLAAAVAE